MNYESRFDDVEEDKMIFLVNATLNNLTGPGSSWSTDLQFVNVNKLDTEYIQPLAKGFYLAQGAYLFEDFQAIYDNKRAIGRYDKDERGLVFRVGTFLRRFGEISLGFLLEDVDMTSTVDGNQKISKFTDMVSSLTLQSHLDLLDTYPFPTSGRTVHIDYQMASSKLGGDVDFHRLAMEYSRYYAIGKRNSIGLQLRLGSDFKTEMPIHKQFILGGRDSFAGYKVEELVGPHLGIAALEYRYRLHQLPSAVGGGIFAIARANVGNVWATAKEITEDFSVRYGGSLGVGVDTVMGPVFADFAMGDGGRQAIYLNIGYTF
jgi:NTE family protein